MLDFLKKKEISISKIDNLYYTIYIIQIILLSMLLISMFIDTCNNNYVKYIKYAIYVLLFGLTIYSYNKNKNRILPEIYVPKQLETKKYSNIGPKEIDTQLFSKIGPSITELQM